MPGIVRSACLLLTLGASVLTAETASAQSVVYVSYRPTERAQIAIWVETAEGRFLGTLALTQATALRGIGNRPGALQMNSGFRWPYGRREGVLPHWGYRRASAEGAQLFRRVIFQNRISEGHASRSSEDSTRDNYYCLSFNVSTTSRDALDAVTCASVFNSDKGRYIAPTDLNRTYSEPWESAPGVRTRYPLDLYSLYPPRRDVMGCPGQSSCIDHPDSTRFAADTRAVMPEIDAVTMATPQGDQDQLRQFSWPTEWADGDYVLYVEVNTEGDYNDQFGPVQYPSPGNPPGANDWDYWATTYGYAYRGQPSVVYRVPFTVGASMENSVAEPVGYTDVEGRSPDLHAMDGRMSNDPSSAAGSGVDRLRLIDGARVSVRVQSREACIDNTAPAIPGALSLSPYSERRDAHRYAHVTFQTPSDDEGVVRYEMRVSSAPITDETSFLAGVPAQAATLDSVAVTIPVEPSGTTIDIDIGGLTYETHYFVGLRAIDGCNQAGPIAVAEFTTLPIEFTTVSPCFVATAAYGTPMASEIRALRRFRDRHLRTNVVGRGFVWLYEQIGPSAADLIRDDEDRRSWSRALLSPVVSFVSWLDSE